jgi:hypothetical protein
MKLQEIVSQGGISLVGNLAVADTADPQPRRESNTTRVRKAALPT